MSIRKRMPRTRGEPIDVDDALLRAWPLPELPGDADKEERGRLLIIAGSREMPGAALLAAVAALRSGAGKLVIATAQTVAIQMALAVPEARVVALEETSHGGLRIDRGLFEQDYDAVLIGPGMQDARATLALVDEVLALAPNASIVLDALAMDVMRETREASHATLLCTPHAGELAHLTGLDKERIVADPLAAALGFVDKRATTVVLKGATTLIAARGELPWRHQGGNAGLAVSGSGDVLAGIIAGLAARGTPLAQAAVFGVALHARAGERLAARFGTLGYLSREIADEVPRLMHDLSAAAG